MSNTWKCVCLGVLSCGALTAAWWYFGWVTVSLIALAPPLGWWLGRGLARRVKGKHEPARKHRGAHSAPPPPSNASEPPKDLPSLVGELLGQGRYAFLLREQIVGNLDPKQHQAAMRRLKDEMSLVPAGEIRVMLRDAFDADDDPLVRRIFQELERVTLVAPCYLDRFAVTNAAYSRFVNAGGYEQMALWDPNIWPGVLEFVDRTGRPGPRFWENGTFPDGADQHPVVGLCWYEAQAYARWMGKRLPTDAEWIKATTWPRTLQAEEQSIRRFPWGNDLDVNKCNVWASGHGGSRPVDDYPESISVGGCYQLIGNTWEWMASPFVPVSYDGQPISLGSPMMSIRGGAFDTYFDNHTSACFQSGEGVTSRRHNIGFRCALSCSDIAQLPGDAEGPIADAEMDQHELELEASTL